MIISIVVSILILVLIIQYVLVIYGIVYGLTNKEKFHKKMLIYLIPYLMFFEWLNGDRIIRLRKKDMLFYDMGKLHYDFLVAKKKRDADFQYESENWDLYCKWHNQDEVKLFNRIKEQEK